MTGTKRTSGGLVVSPKKDAFSNTYNAGTAQVVWTRLIADLETPVSAMLKLARDRPMSFLFESVEGGSVRGRYSIIGLDPDVIWRANGDSAEINRQPETSADAFEADTVGTMASLRALIADSRIDLPKELPPMAAGIFGYMGYDTVRLIEHLPSEPPDVLGLPDCILMRPTIMVIFDAVKDEMTLVTPVYPDAGQTADAAYSTARQRLTQVLSSLEEALPHLPAPDGKPAKAVKPRSNTTSKKFMAMVERAKEYIRAGDIFQVVLSQRFYAPFKLPSFSLYRALRRTNPSPFLYHLDFGSFSLVGSSPEILVRVRTGEVTIRPLAGTRPRGETPEADKQLEIELLADPKERAEHLMLLDLGRNDVGRVSSIGSVGVRESFTIERYSHVMHIGSHVTGQLDTKKHDAIDALMAGLPAGTLSGAPKVRAMEIIDELEKVKRGPYAGCVGYFSADGEMDTCIVLRTALVKDEVMYVQAGAGIVADSDPHSEQMECVYKAAALFRAAEEAIRFAARTMTRNW